MNWQAITTTFGLLLLAELGDKTQLAVMAQSAKYGRPWEVFLGASVALAIVSLLGACVGGVCYKFLPEKVIRYAASAGFIIMGIWMLLKKD